jgi:S1-C subfamily serine protease
MHLQFNCPFCQTLLSADATAAGSQIQCPACQRPFTINALPQVQARVIVTQPPPMPPYDSGARGPGPRQAAPRPATPPKTKQEMAAEQKKAEGRAILVIAAVLVVGGGSLCGLVWIFSFLSKVVPKADPYSSPEIVAHDKARREQVKKEKEEEEKELVKQRADSIAALAKLFNASDKVAEALMAEIEGVREDHHRLTSDADSNNDPTDIPAYYTQRLAQRADANNVLRNWLGGKPATAIGAFLWGDEGAEMREKGNTPDFLMAGDYHYTGTGFFVSLDGWLITNEHVVKNRKEVDLRGFDSQIIKAKVVKTDKDADLALLKVDQTPPAALSLASGELSLGSMVFTIGFPNADIQGVEAKFTEGSISSLAGMRDDHDAYQTSIPIQQGNSGGALIDAGTGLVAGVIHAKLDAKVADNVSYAIKSGVLARLISSVGDVEGIAAPSTGPKNVDRATNIERVKRATVLVLVK